ncbi:hypothetical protein N7512_000583 [Penicillium capsulatum]|nr:hypothetical protein N7512_000583 [Penicillium capsulatum]
MALWSLLVGPFLLGGLVSSVAVDQGRLASVDGINYYVGANAVSKLESSVPFNWADSDEIRPLTVIRTDASTFTSHILQKKVDNLTASDDVFQSGFIHALFLQYDGNARARVDASISGKDDGAIVIASPGFHAQKDVIPASLKPEIPEGPYFISTKTGDLFHAYRLYPDHQLAFTEAALSDGRDGFKPLPAATGGAMTKSIAVPSRLYYIRTSQKPLAGLRLGVKDIYDVKGLRTSGGNRAFYDLYPPRNTTGPAIQRLLDAGAILVGKMGTVQFANGDNPTADWVDFHCPFNPRGDGYQSPGGSSSGPAAGIASYDWLDIAVGSDTGGSMRNPGGLQGIYANRPSTGAVSLDNVLPLCSDIDTAGVFARNAATSSRVMHAWYRNFTDYREYPGRIFYPASSFPNTSTKAGEMLEQFVVKVERFLDAKRESVDISELWKKTHPSNAPDNVTDLLNTTYAILTSVGQYRSLTLPFYDDYAVKHDGRRPFINPGPLVRWTWGQNNGGNKAYDTALHNRTVFREWWETEGYGKPHKKTCSEGVYIYPYSTGERQYRNVYTDAPTEPPMGFKNGRISNMADVPDLVVPIGEIPYTSTVSLKTEYMPVTLSFVASRGCDLMLANLVRDLEAEGILKPVKTGPRMYPG